MVTTQVKIQTPQGLHLRPAGELAEYALKYQSKIMMSLGDKEVSAKSLLGVLSLGVREETELTIFCEGIDEQEALDGMIAFIKSL